MEAGKHCAICGMLLHDLNVARYERRPGVAGRPVRLFYPIGEGARNQCWCRWCLEEHEATDFDELHENGRLTEENLRELDEIRVRREQGRSLLTRHYLLRKHAATCRDISCPGCAGVVVRTKGLPGGCDG